MSEANVADGPWASRRVASAGASDRRLARRHSRKLPPGWPLTLTFVPFGLWWVLGLSNLIGIIGAVAMAIQLAHRRRLRVPRGFGLWLVMLAMVFVGVLVLQVNAPGAVPGASSTRYVTWSFRLAWYLAATITLIYVGNMRNELGDPRIARTGAAMFLTIAAGGWLGILAPRLNFPSMVEMLLPNRIASIDFVKFLVHPQVTQLYEGAATDTPRPSAPFPYSNIWGLNFACFLPFFVYAWLGKTAGWRKPFGVIILGLALVPAIQSMNRGLWLALGVLAIMTAVLAALSGRLGALGVLLGTAALVSAVIAFTPVGGFVKHRLDNPTSNDTRTNLSARTVETVLDGSPIVGFGTTRDVQGTFTSIAGGATSACPQCSPPALGTQGHLWLVIFSQGLVGLLAYFGFFLIPVVAAIRTRTALAVTGLGAVLAHLVTTPVYDSIGTSMMAVMIGVALIWREWERSPLGRAEAASGSRTRTVGSYLGFLRRNAIVIGVCTSLGLGVAAFAAARGGTTAVGTVSVYLPEEPGYLVNDGLPSSMDSEAFLAQNSTVRAAVAQAIGAPVERTDLYLSADPNTRILNITYYGRDVDAAQVGAAAAAAAALKQRAFAATAKQTEVLTTMRRSLDSLDKSLAGVSEQLLRLEQSSVDLSRVNLQGLRQSKTALASQAGRIRGRIIRAQADTFDGGTLVRPAVARLSTDKTATTMASGLVLGPLVGILLALLLDLGGNRVGRGRHVREDTGLPVLGTANNGHELSMALRHMQREFPTATFHQADPDKPVLLPSIAPAISRSGTDGPAPGHLVLIVSSRSAMRSLRLSANRLSASAHRIEGVVIEQRRVQRDEFSQ